MAIAELKRKGKRNRKSEFTDVGREQLLALLEHGLTLDSYVCDIGCGTLRCGRWVIPLLEPGHYCGVEPVPERVKEGLEKMLDPALVELKKPRFDHNFNFDFSPFGVKFTHFVARSIWSHASKSQIEQMLDGMVAHGDDPSVMLASFRATGPNAGNDYKGEDWVGKSHESDQPGIVAHSVEWIRDACDKRELSFEVSTRGPVKKNGQVWAVIRKEAADARKRRKRNQASQLARQIKHNVRTMKFATEQMIEQLGLKA